ncbi:hypothetical protein, partial [Paraburkholderia sp. J8-2]
LMMNVTAASQGDELDRIGRAYASDLHDFGTFVDSPAETDELRALHEATDAAGKAIGTFAMEVSPELNGNLKRWRDLYRSLPHDEAAS